MVHDGVANFGESTANVAVRSGFDHAQFVSQAVPSSMVPGATYPISITMKNSGSVYWAPGNVSLASQNPTDNTTWGLNRVAVPDYIAPGANATFTFNVTAPTTPGTYNFQWQVMKANGLFGPATPNVAVNVNPDEAVFVSQSVPASMTPGRVYSVSVTLQNAGSSTWSTESLHRLGSYNPQDNTTWGPSRVDIPGEVPPGASVTIPFTITAPTTPGTYNFQWRLVHDTTWFGGISQNVAVNVGSAGSPVTGMHFIHVDHLNTPREIYDASAQLKWRWEQTEPFGNTVPDENPSSLGAYEFNLRFPGQYADRETNLYYNYFRDFDPGVGRYTQSDPIGLLGGINTYDYVNGAPLGLIDPTGLYMTTVQAFCMQRPEECFEILGQIVQNTAEITQGCVPDDVMALVDTLQDIGSVLGVVSLATTLGVAKLPAVANVSSRAARRQAMRQAGIPTSQQPVQQIHTRQTGTRQLAYKVPTAGGGNATAVVTNQTTDRVVGHGPHWEAGLAKTPQRTDSYGRIRVSNNKAKVDYGQ